MTLEEQAAAPEGEAVGEFECGVCECELVQGWDTIIRYPGIAEVFCDRCAQLIDLSLIPLTNDPATAADPAPRRRAHVIVVAALVTFVTAGIAAILFPR